MNHTLDPGFDPRIADWLEDDPVRAPSTILPTVMAAYPSIAQRRPWRVSWRLPMLNRIAMVAAPVALVAFAFVILAIPRAAEVPNGPITPSLAPSASAAASSTAASTGPTAAPATTTSVPAPAATIEPTSPPTPSPAATMTPGAVSSPGFAGTFLRPFEYSVPIGSELSVTTASPQMHALTEGSTETYPGFGYEPVKDVRGVTVAFGIRASTHSDLGTDDVRLEPATFFTDLQANPALAVGPATAVEVGGLAAVQADTEAVEARSYPDIHLGPLGSPPPEESTLLALGFPSRLSVVVMSDGFMIVHVWAANDEELAAWLPEADELIDSIRFVDEL